MRRLQVQGYGQTDGVDVSIPALYFRFPAFICPAPLSRRRETDRRSQYCEEVDGAPRVSRKITGRPAPAAMAHVVKNSMADDPALAADKRPAHMDADDDDAAAESGGAAAPDGRAIVLFEADAECVPPFCPPARALRVFSSRTSCWRCGMHAAGAPLRLAADRCSLVAALRFAGTARAFGGDRRPQPILNCADIRRHW